MEWIVRFVGVWTLFFLLVDWKELKVNIWCGIFSMFLQTAVDGLYIKHGFYKISDPVIEVFGSSLFFLMGPAFVIAILIAQFQPSKRWAQILYVILLSAVYDFEEFLLLVRKELVYVNWSFITSVIFNLILMMSLSWFAIVVLKRGVSRQ